ncbi:MAG TPA: hypothetical protein VM581_00040 [Magnetospirillaceae bacterium]|nr:hypothetical protein [Magnetospirillaceae bacterium]
MAQQIFYQPNRQRKKEDEPDIAPLGSIDPQARIDRAKQASAAAGGALGDIDKALGDNASGGGGSNGPPGKSESDARADKNRRAATAERRAARQGASTKRSLADQEAGINLGDAKSLYAKSAENRRRGGPRGVFIGLGAGGGIVSVIAGFGFMLPFKMPGIMDTLIGDSGKRLEHVIEKRAERVFLQFILRGTKAAGLNGNIIATGNPIGDYFANLRTANFEVDLKDQFGLEFKPGPDKTVTLVHDGRDLGDAKTPDDILKILDSGKSLSKSDLRKIIKSTQTWPFYKRAKFVKWLRIKYNIPRFGAREIEASETEDEYNKAVKEEHIVDVETRGNFANGADFLKCAAEAGDCAEINKTDVAEKVIERTEKAIGEAAKELATEGVKKATTSVIKAALPKIIAVSSAVAIPYVGEIDMAARLVHGLGKIIDNDLIQKMHAQFIARSSIVLGAAYAGYSDQSKAGDIPASTVGMFADQFDGWEASASYSLINSGKVAGEVLDGMERVNESIALPVFAGLMKTMFGTVGWIGRGPFEAWYYTVSQLFDLVGEVTGPVTDWIIAHTPAKALLEKLTPIIDDIFEGIFKFIGMYIDPLAVGAKLAMYIHQGFLAAFNGISKETGMRLLSLAQGRVVDAEIRQERLADLADQPLYERLFNLDNPESLATRLATTIPGTSNPVLAFTTTSTRLVASAPGNFARATTATSYAEGEPPTSEELFGINMYGGTAADLNADIDPSTYSSQSVTCPENRDDTFNHCRVDKSVVDAMNCSVVKCADMTTTSNGEFDGMFVDSNVRSIGSFIHPLSNISQMITPALLEVRRLGA